MTTRFKTCFVAVMCLLFMGLSGCASFLENGTPAPPAQPGKAVVFVNHSTLNYPKASTNIREIDGEVISTYWTWKQPHQAVLEPGRHMIVISAYSKGYGLDARVEGDLEAGHVYEIISVLGNAGKFDVSLVDVLSPEQKVLYKAQVSGYFSR